MNKVFQGEVLRFISTSGAMLALKICLMQLFLLVLTELPAYAVVQVWIFAASYLSHSFWTFRQPLGWRAMARFFQTIVVFQTLDYLVFSFLFTRYAINSTVVILLASAVVFVARFFFVRRALKR